MDADDAAPRRAVRRAGWLAAFGLFAVGVFAWRGAPSGSAPAQAAPSSVPPTESPPVAQPEHDSRTLSQPSGNPPGIRCELAQKVTGFLDAELAAPPIAPTPAELAESWASLLDPHGLWTAAPDSPARAELLEAAPSLLTSFSRRGGACEGASRVARVWQPAQERLRELYDAAFAQAQQRAPAPSAEVFRLAADPLFEDDPVTRPAAELARDLGARLGAFAARFPEETAVIEHARARFFPTELERLRDLAILAALRAYVPLVDPHGDFAPLDEEWSLYAGDDTLDSGSPLWGDIARTPLGARITSDPSPPLQLDDVVLSIDDLTLAGASVDQVEQAARSAPEGATRVLRVLRQGEPRLLTLRLTEEPPAEAESLEVERLRYGAGDKVVLRIRIPDVTDDMGEQLAAVLAREAPGASALLLDLRGNGGGSLDAAVEALGLFVPGAKLFPLIHRGAVTEVLQAGQVGEPYVGPIGVLVDGDTASAAEMLAGALQAYGRATLIGARTFGKGCVQEYFDDVVADGVLRVTTLQFVMPNGKPLQQIGLTPDLTLALPAALERESELARQPITFGGPDVRSPNVSPGPSWPPDSASVSRCEDPVVCRAISRLAGSKPSAVGRGPKLPDPSARGVRPRAGTR